MDIQDRHQRRRFLPRGLLGIDAGAPGMQDKSDGACGIFLVAESSVLSIVLILLVVFVVLALLLAAWTLFFQNYIYSEPVEAVYWRAPAASAVLTLFLSLWVVLDYGTIKNRGDEGRYRPLHEVSSSETETYEYLTIVYRDRTEDKYTRQGDGKYRNKSGKEPLSKAKSQMIASHKDGDKHVFKPVEKDGTVVYVEEGNPSRSWKEDAMGQVSIFHFGWLFVTLLLNFGFLAVWFVTLWLLLHYQWAHALGLAFVFWLVSLFVLPMILTQAEKVRKDRLPPVQTAQSARSIRVS
jgi:hypothetical protein